MQSILVKDYMDQNPHAIQQSASVCDVVKLLTKDLTTGAPVVDEQNNLVGFISEQDCIRELLNEAFYAEESKAVTRLMVTKVLTVNPDTSIIEVAENMSKGPPKNYPVVDHGKLVGILSRRSVLEALMDYNEGVYFHPNE
ncbi:MAG: CBS domain-containing protein [Cellvibrionaceae bacterium]|nr:CBS domain-containing protein [Cellvibrionaceae bacterium]